MIRPSGIGEGMTLLSRADTLILHCIGRGITDAKGISREIGLSTERIYARALEMKRNGILEDRKGIRLGNSALAIELSSFLSVSKDRADILANMGIRYLMALREPAPGRIIADRTGVTEAAYFKWYRKAVKTGIVVSDGGIHRIDHGQWPGIVELLDTIDSESRRADGRIPAESKIIWMDRERIIFSGRRDEPYRMTAFSVFCDDGQNDDVFYTTCDEQQNEQDLFDDAVRICEATDDPDLRLKTVEFLIDNLGVVVPDNDFVMSLSRAVRGHECRGWPDAGTLKDAFGDLSELMNIMIPDNEPGVPPNYRTETFRLYPNRTEEHRLEQIMETCLVLFNELQGYFATDAIEGRIPSEREIRNHMTHELKQNSENRQRYNDSPSSVLTEICSRVHWSLISLRKKAESGMVHIPVPKTDIRSFLYPQVGRGVSFPEQPEGSRKIVRLGGIGDIRYDGHTVKTDGKRFNSLGRRVPYENPVPGVMKRCRILRRNTGKWEMQITYDSGDVSPVTVREHPLSPIGIDLGIKDMIITSEGEHIPNFRELSRLRKDIAREQNRMNGCDKDTEEWEKQRKRLAHLYEHYANRQRDDLHKLSLDLVRRHDLIVFEDINIRALMMYKEGRHTRYGQSEASWRRLTEMVDYKAASMGVRVVYVDPRNTSQLCSGCGKMVKKNITVRIHECPYCGLVMDRDENAARNVLKRGLEKINGADTGDRTRASALARQYHDP